LLLCRLSIIDLKTCYIKALNHKKIEEKKTYTSGIIN